MTIKSISSILFYILFQFNEQYYLQYEKPPLVIELEAQVLRMLQNVETEVDDDDDMETMRKIMKLP